MVDEGYFGDSILVAGLTFVVYAGVMVMIYYLVSPVTYGIFNGFLEADLGLAEGPSNWILPYISNVLNIAFFVGIFSPAIWFIFWVFHREPSETVHYR